MLSWKTLSLFVAAAAAMNGVTAIEQGYGGGVNVPSVTTATPADESVVQETPASQDTALPSGSGSNGLFTGSAVDGSSAIDQGTSTPTPGKTGITSSSSGGPDLYTGSAVEGSSAIDQGSYGSDTSSSTSGSATPDETPSLTGSSTTGSDVASSSAIETSASLAGSSADSSDSQNTQGSATQSQGSDATTPAGSEATTPTSEAGSAATIPTSEAGSEATTPTSSTGSDSNCHEVARKRRSVDGEYGAVDSCRGGGELLLESKLRSD
ncbi:hypothetical protein PInf_019094 [Phytophthora infestans]|nr:hypothetical protein PInf_019094 [Phytophthora infestans]